MSHVTTSAQWSGGLNHGLTTRTSSSDSEVSVPSEKKVGFELFFQLISDDFNNQFHQRSIYSTTPEPTFIEKLQSFSNRNFKVNDMGLVASTFKFSIHLAIYTVSLVAIKAIANSLSWVGIACVVAGYFALSEEITSSITEKAQSLLAALQLDNNLLEDFPIQIQRGTNLSYAWTELAGYVNDIFSSSTRIEGPLSAAALPEGRSYQRTANSSGLTVQPFGLRA
jgi:hypothetical protein